MEVALDHVVAEHKAAAVRAGAQQTMHLFPAPTVVESVHSHDHATRKPVAQLKLRAFPHVIMLPLALPDGQVQALQAVVVVGPLTAMRE